MLENNKHSESGNPADSTDQLAKPYPNDNRKPMKRDIVKHREFLTKNGEPRLERAITFVIDKYWNIPLWKGKNADGDHQCPKGPHDASNWAWICHRPSLAAERWQIIPWHGWYAIRFEPVGWECKWRIVGVYFTFDQAHEAM